MNVSEPGSAYQWGKTCARKGLIGNPYPINSDDWKEWHRGYSEGLTKPPKTPTMKMHRLS